MGDVTFDAANFRINAGFTPWIQRPLRKAKYGAPTRAARGETAVFFVEGGCVYVKKREFAGFGVDPDTGKYTITVL